MMQVFNHFIYEYKKGVRNLILHTTSKDFEDKIVEKLELNQISYIIYPVNGKKINVFFGDDACLQILKRINKASLSEYTQEEDFILGIMLGYDRLKQCERFLKRKSL